MNDDTQKKTVAEVRQLALDLYRAELASLDHETDERVKAEKRRRLTLFRADLDQAAARWCQEVQRIEEEFAETVQRLERERDDNEPS